MSTNSCWPTWVKVDRISRHPTTSYGEQGEREGRELGRGCGGGRQKHVAYIAQLLEDLAHEATLTGLRLEIRRELGGLVRGRLGGRATRMSDRHELRQRPGAENGHAVRAVDRLDR